MSIVGAVHGRFQPFHNEHLEYVLEALHRCEHLLIGITQFDRGIQDDTSPGHRLKLEENPFSYWERTLLITSALMHIGIQADRYAFVPFPIQEPSRIWEFVPNNVTMFTTICDEWNREKIRRLEEEGFSVEVLIERETKKFEGKTVRRCIETGSDDLINMVPAGAYEALKRLIEMKRVGDL